MFYPRIMSLLCVQVRVAVVTAAGYGLDGNKYAKRLRGLLDRFIQEGIYICRSPLTDLIVGHH